MDINIISMIEPLAADTVEVIRTGNTARLKQLLAEHPELVVSRIADLRGGMRSLLHVATDWPGHFPNVAETITTLIEAGADVNAAFVGRHAETPLHWAASSDDVDALDALLGAGANIEAAGGVIGGGTPMDDAVAFGQWQAARRLVERGARTRLWHSAALGLTERLHAYFTSGIIPEPDHITEAFWQACHGGQKEAAEILLAKGADINWVGYQDQRPLDIARQVQADELVEWLIEHGAKPAQS